MAEFKDRVEQLASIMDEFHLGEASLEGEGWRVAFKRRHRESPSPSSETSDANGHAPTTHQGSAAHVHATAEEPDGVPISSPMNGIYYSSPSPTAPLFVTEGESVEEGQVLALIEAMKVFNEIVAPTSGRVVRVLATNAQLVQPGDVLMVLAEEA